MKRHSTARSTVKIADLERELGIEGPQFYRVLQEVKIRVIEGQKNLDQSEVMRVKHYLQEKKRREELKSRKITIPSIVKVQTLAQALELSVGDVLGALLKNGVLATLNDNLDYETAAIISSDLGYTTEENVAALEQETLTPEKLEEILKKEEPAQQKPRPPVVTIMGHVDHGKTTLLDSIRSANVAAREAGGITQAISGYQVDYNGRTVTFIDTPGHETFQFMRRRGASLADIAILVVAADDGVKPQTTEALKHAQAAKIPIIVAINKIDKTTANPDKVKTQLGELGLVPEEWGGTTSMVPVSALKKEGLDTLLETILLTADLHPPVANPDRAALGSVVEGRLDKNFGPLATVLLHSGTLHTGDNVVIGRVSGRVRRLIDFRGKPVSAAGPSTPITVMGLDDVPEAGDILQAVEAKEEARSKAQARRAPLKSLVKQNEDDTRPTLPLVLKADTRGSLEALEQVITSMVPPEVRLSMIRAEVGDVSDSDVLTARDGGALVYAFNTRVGGMAKKLAEKEHVPVKSYDIIYQLSEDVRKEIDDRLPVDIIRTTVGRLKVLKVFFSIQKRKIVGGEVATGEIKQGDKAIIWRPASAKATADKQRIGEGTIIELQREKRALEVAQQGDQVGLTYEGKGKIKAGDVLEIVREEKVKRKTQT